MPPSRDRIDRYVPLVQNFAARAVLFHESVAQKLGLHATDVKVLRLLESGPMSAGELADEAVLTPAAMTALIDRLEQRGYAVRERDPGDRRRVTVRTVPAKLRELDRLYRGLNVEMEKLLSTYSAAGFAAIVDYLERGAAVLTEQGRKLRSDDD